MDRAGAGQAAVAGAVRLVDDPLEGTLLMVGGAGPFVARVSRARGSAAGYHLDAVEGEWPNPRGTMWPTVVPRDMVGFPQVVIVPTAGLRPVDLLRIVSGVSYQRTGRDGYYYWQAADRLLLPVTEAELRRALASPWLRRVRGDGAPGAVRAIATGRLRD